MPPHSNRRSRCRPSRRRRGTLRRFFRRRRHEGAAFLRALWASHPAVSLPVAAALVLVCWLAVNWLYHALHKPTELFFPLDNVLDKNLAETWSEYGPLFRQHATAVITPELLAALAQVEGSGNPVARTYWRWRVSWNPFQWYQPASSAVGMYQITWGTFQAAKRYCVHDHVVVEDGPWHDIRSCWFNSLYTRVLPSHAIELTAALLDRQVAEAVGSRSAPLLLKQDVAAIIHLCGASVGRLYAARGFRLAAGQHCGAHDVRGYLAKVRNARQFFARLPPQVHTRG
ncbi:MAG TPA: lytic transglycosylase domain-containing protein [Nitrospira sp.]|nr:lytic transglycosylase domain-containing protein [Nitrospira sp.]